MKKLLAIFLFALVLCTLIPFAAVPVSAADVPTVELVVEETELNAGDEFKVTVNLLNLEDTAGLISALVEVGFDTDVFEAVTYFDEDEEMWLPQIEVGSKYNASSNKYISYGQIYDDGTMKNCLVKYMRATASAAQVRREEYFCTITLKVKDDAAPGTYDLNVVRMDGVYYGNEMFQFATTKASVTIGGSAPACEHEYENGCSTICIHCGEERPAPAHNVIHVEAKEADCVNNGNIEHWYCSECGQHWLDAERTLFTNANAVKIAASCMHNAIYKEGTPARCHFEGVKEHWYCANCDVYYLDAACNVVTNEKGLIIPALKPDVDHVEAKESDCVNDGNLEYWYCSVCEQYWLDAELTMNTNKDEVICPASGHNEVAADNGDGTHRIECCVCLTPLKDNIPHDYTNGNTCVCGKTYCEHGQLVYEANQDLGHFVKCALCGAEIRYESHVGEYYIVHIDLGQIAIAIDCKDCGFYAVNVWYSDPEVSTQPGTCMSPAVTTYVFNIEELPLDAKGGNLGDVVYAPEKDGETDLIYRVNEDNWTVVITVIGELDGNNHVSDEISYPNITDTHHTVYHPCCEATETVAHTADKKVAEATCQHGELYECICGEVVETTAPDTTKHTYSDLYVCIDCGYVQKFTYTFTINGEFYAELKFAYGEIVRRPSYTAPEGYTLRGWMIHNTMPDFNVTTDATLTVNEYGIYNDWAQITTGRFYGETIEMPEPGREGYVFKGWEFYAYTYNESTEKFELLEKYDGTTMPAFDLYAKSIWECNHDSDFHDYETDHDGTHHWNVCECGQTVGEKIPHDQNEVLYGGNCQEPADYRCSCGYRYAGEKNPDNHASDDSYRYKDTDGDTHTTYHPCCGEDIETLPHDYTTTDDEYTCVCGAVQKFTYTFTINGEFYAEYEIEYGAYVPRPEFVVPEGYTFIGWIVHNEMPPFNVTIDATLTNKYTILLILDGKQYGDMLTFTYGEAIVLPVPTKDAEGCTTYTFSWGDVPATMPAENLIFTGSFTAETNHNVKYFPEKTPTCLEAGYRAHWYCDACGKYWLEQGLSNPVGYDRVVLVNMDNHASNAFTYEINKEEGDEKGYFSETHNKFHACCGEPAATNEAHSYNEQHVCACGQVETFAVYNEWAQIATSRFYGETIEMPEPGREGYVFKGWEFYAYTYNENTEKFELLEKYDGTTMPAFDLYAKPLWEVEHVCDPSERIDNGDGTHTVKCSCGEIIDKAEKHDYTTSDAEYTCVCGKVEEFTLEIYVGATDEYVYLTVPYGANLLEVLAKAAEDEKIPALGEKVRVNDVYYNGYNIPSYYDHQLPNNEWVDIDENSTMPANDFSVMQNCDFHGWEFSYHGEEYVGAQYHDEYFGWITEAGWRYIEENFDDVEGGAWYYFSEIEIVDGNYRYSNFVRAEGLSRVPYNTELGHGALAEDLAYNPNFKDAEEAWYYFDEDGKYEINKNGIFDGKYVKNGMIPWHPGFVTVGGELYYFVGDKENGGNIWANGDVIVSRLNGEDFVKGGVYNFINGKLNTAMHGIVNEATTGKLFYYINGHRQKGIGLTQIEPGKYIYVRSSGELAVGEYYIPANGLGVVSTLYTFDAKGFMVNPKYTNVNGIVDGYYYVDGKIVYGAGLINIDGDIYYVRSSGKVATGEYYITNTNGMPGFQKGMKLTFGADGKLLTKTTDFGSVINGYYYVDGKIAYGAGVVKMEDENGVFYIYVKSNGQVATGIYWPTKTNGLLESGKYDWGTDGKYYPGN